MLVLNGWKPKKDPAKPDPKTCIPKECGAYCRAAVVGRRQLWDRALVPSFAMEQLNIIEKHKITLAADTHLNKPVHPK